jgi:hypothetical protein
MSAQTNILQMRLAGTPDAIPHSSEVLVGEPNWQQFTGRLYAKMADGTMVCINPEITLESLGASPLLHQHMPGDIVGAGNVIGRNVPLTGDAAANQVVLGSDTRLSDARTPVAHGHGISEITDLADSLATLTTALNGKQPAGHYAGEIHSHLISQVSGLRSELDAIVARIAALENA